MQVRKNIIKFLGRPASVIPLTQLIWITGQKLIIPVYHIISDTDLPHIKHLYACKNTTDFISDLDFLLKYYKPIDVSALLAYISGEKKIDENAFILTFDDGLREFHDVIAPILQQKGVPAICFCNSDFVDNKNLFYRYKVSLLIEHFIQNAEILLDQNLKEWFEENLHTDILNYKKALLSIPYANRNLIDGLATCLQFSFDKFLSERQPYITTEQIRNLQSRGFVFGAHSMDHPEYRFLLLAEQISQTEQSLQFILNNHLASCRLFAFPFSDYGVEARFFKAMAVSEVAPQITFGCAGLKKDTIRNNLQRIPLEVAGKSAEEIIKTEYVYYVAKSLFGKNTIHRR